MDLETITRALSKEVGSLTFGDPVACVYNPLEYAWEAHAIYLQRYGRGTKRVVFLGMNPGPFGMTQTGVPFGEVTAVRDWLGIEAPIQRPVLEHPKRPIEGFACKRSEVSGRRLWGFLKKRFGQPEHFFKEHFVLNYCPLVFLEASGRNLTPDKLPVLDRKALDVVCGKHVRKAVLLLEPEWVIGIGAFAQKCAQRSLSGLDLKIGQVLHPSPASPRANKNWEGFASQELSALLGHSSAWGS